MRRMKRATWHLTIGLYCMGYMAPTAATAQIQSQRFVPTAMQGLSVSIEQRLAALEAKNRELTAQVEQLSKTLAQSKQASDKESFNDRFRLLAIEKWEDLKTNTDNQNFGELWTSSQQFRAWGDSFYKLYLGHKHSYLDDATAAGRYAVYETSSPYPLVNGGSTPDQLDVLGPGLAGVQERFIYRPPTQGPADGMHISPLPTPLPPLQRP